MYNFLQGTKIIIEVLFPGEFRIGWEYEGVKYIPGSGSYYDLDTALDQAWQAFCREFPHLTQRVPDWAAAPKSGGEARSK